jgi:hypothetical protein
LCLGQEVTVISNPSPDAEDAAWLYEATFDGSSGEGVAGAGATLWAHHINGQEPTCIARARVAIPWAASAQVAEAIGCRSAISLLLALQPATRAARVVGDNLAVVRFLRWARWYAAARVARSSRRASS